MTNPTNEHREQARHKRHDHADEQRLQEMLDSLPDCPTEEEAEAILQATGTSGKDVVNTFIERLLRERLTFEIGIKDFIRDRGRHDGEHIFNLTTCSECDKSYIRAEEALDSLVRPDKHAVASALSSRDAEIREVLEGLITSVVDEGNGPVLHWCPTDDSGTFECEPACLAARVLYAKLQPRKEGNDVAVEKD